MIDSGKKRDMKLALSMLKIIERHDINNPVKGQALAEMLNISWRNVADIIEILRDCGYKIGSNKGNPMGYFVARDAGELHDTTMHMENMAKKILSRVNKMRNWGTSQPTVFEQEVLISGG
jgi:biotin operon repressor